MRGDVVNGRLPNIIYFVNLNTNCPHPSFCLLQAYPSPCWLAIRQTCLNFSFYHYLISLKLKLEPSL